jgi:hypothetical protein
MVRFGSLADVRASVSPPGGTTGQSMVEFALVVPVLFLLFLGIADFGRLYATMLTVEAAARQAADFGSFDSQYWSDPSGTLEKMEHRACVAASTLPDYVGTTDLSDPLWTCTNPTFSAQLVDRPGGTTCTDPVNPFPCWLEVTLQYEFHLINPFHITIGSMDIGLPDTLTFSRTSTFALSDLHLDPLTTPAPSP